MDFKELCLQNGFRHTKGRYYRCIGDGVLQGVFECQKRYIEPLSPEYSERQRKAKYITFGIWSLYSNLPEYVFSGECNGGPFAPVNLLGRRWQPGPFMGNAEDRRMMEAYGIPFLNSVNTQAKICEAVEHLSMIEFQQLLGCQVDLCGAYIKSGRAFDAEMRIESKVFSLWMHFFDHLDTYEASGLPEDFWSKKADMLTETKDLVRLWGMIAGGQKENIQHYLAKNYKLNMERVAHYKIPVLCITGDGSVC